VIAPWLEITRGKAPLVVSLPHSGTEIPDRIEWRLTTPGIGRMDTGWRLHTLHAALAAEIGATTVRTRTSRTVVDVDRDPSSPALVPTTTFDGVQLYRHGDGPAAAEVAQRRATWFDPYHAALAAELTRLRSRHPRVILYDAQSVRSRIPRLFPGELPPLNLGIHDGTTCDPALREALRAACESSALPCVTDGRFKGGWTTRNHARPSDGVHAVHLTLAQRAYMDEDRPGAWDPERAAPLQAVLRGVLETALGWVREEA
jgi:formiminoglutamase